MGHLHRHVVAETLKMFCITMGLSVLLLTFAGGAKEGIRHGLPPLLILQLLPFVVLEMLRYTVPGCLLFAVCSVCGRMSAMNELTAIKSVGVNPFRVVWPVLVGALLLSLGTFQLYDASASWARPNLHRILVESVADVAYGVLRTEQSFSSQGLSIVVRAEVADRKLIQPVISIPPQGNTPEMTLTAAEAELKFNALNGMLQLICYDSRVDVGGEWTLDYPDRFVHDVPLAGSGPQSDYHKSPANLARGAIPRQIEHERQTVAGLQNDLDTLPPDLRAEREAQIEHHQTRLYRLQAETQRRLANGFACFCFALVGIPVAIWWRSADNVSAFFACFLPILLVYYPLLVVGETAARRGIFPGASVWLADAVLILAGIILTWRVLRR